MGMCVVIHMYDYLCDLKEIYKYFKYPNVATKVMMITLAQKEDCFEFKTLSHLKSV